VEAVFNKGSPNILERVNMFSLPSLPHMKQTYEEIDLMQKNRIPPLKDMYAAFPYQRPHYDALYKFCDDMRTELPFQGGLFSKETVDFVNKKFVDMIEHKEYSLKPLELVREHLEKEANRLSERMHFLHEEKITTILEEHPEWAAEIRRKLYNMELEDPFDGTPLAEL